MRTTNRHQSTHKLDSPYPKAHALLLLDLPTSPCRARRRISLSPESTQHTMPAPSTDLVLDIATRFVLTAPSEQLM